MRRPSGRKVPRGNRESSSPIYSPPQTRRKSSVIAYQPNGKRYDDPINRLKWGLNDLFTCLREGVAIGVYKFKGLI